MLVLPSPLCNSLPLVSVPHYPPTPTTTGRNPVTLHMSRWAWRDLSKLVTWGLGPGPDKINMSQEFTLWGREYTPVRWPLPLFIPWRFTARAPQSRRMEAIFRWLQLCGCQCPGNPKKPVGPPGHPCCHVPAAPPLSMEHAVVHVGVYAEWPRARG